MDNSRLLALPGLPSSGASPALDPSVVCPPCGKCCRYVSVGIESPSSVGRVSTIIYLLYHRTLSVYLSHDGQWFLLVPTECENLRPNGLCGVYEDRPFICREYDVDGCEGTNSEPAEKKRFEDARSFVSWLSRDKSGLYARCLKAGIVPPGLQPAELFAELT
jgi:uncharacterized protein